MRCAGSLALTVRAFGIFFLHRRDRRQILSRRRAKILGFDTREGWRGWGRSHAHTQIGDLIIEGALGDRRRRRLHPQI